MQNLFNLHVMKVKGYQRASDCVLEPQFVMSTRLDYQNYSLLCVTLPPFLLHFSVLVLVEASGMPRCLT